MHVGSRTGQQNSIYGVEKSIDVGDVRTAGEHQRESVRDFADAQKVVYPNVLDGVDGVRFITQCVASSQANGAWQPMRNSQ